MRIFNMELGKPRSLWLCQRCQLRLFSSSRFRLDLGTLLRLHDRMHRHSRTLDPTARSWASRTVMTSLSILLKKMQHTTTAGEPFWNKTQKCSSFLLSIFLPAATRCQTWITIHHLSGQATKKSRFWSITEWIFLHQGNPIFYFFSSTKSKRCRNTNDLNSYLRCLRAMVAACNIWIINQLQDIRSWSNCRSLIRSSLILIAINDMVFSDKTVGILVRGPYHFLIHNSKTRGERCWFWALPNSHGQISSDSRATKADRPYQLHVGSCLQYLFSILAIIVALDF